MGGFDTYCALCGVVNGTAEHQEYDPSIVKSEEDVSWTLRSVVLCENPNATSVNKAYVTGVGTDRDCGFFGVSRGDDVNFDTSLQMIIPDPAYYPQPRYIIVVHQWHQDQPFAIPMHVFCYQEILCRIVDFYMTKKKNHEASSPIDIDKNTFYRVLKSMYSEENYPRVPVTIDYGDVTERQEQYWWPQKGDEWLVMEPGKIEELAKYYRNMPKLKPHGAQQAFKKVTNNVFSTLPESLILQVVAYLSLKDFNSLRASTPVIAQLSLSPGFWKSRILCDMPWLYDLPYDTEGTDWKAVYMRLQVLSHKSSPQKLHGLANRRRIWKICDQIVKPYVQVKIKEDVIMPTSEFELLSEATSSKTPRLIWPESAETVTKTLLFVGDAANLGKQNLIISVFMRDDIFVGFSTIESAQKVHAHSVGRTDVSEQVTNICIEEDNWIVGLITFSQVQNKRRGRVRTLSGMKILTRSGQEIAVGQLDGDQRITHVSATGIAIGLTVTWSEERGISKLGLLEVPMRANLHNGPTDLDLFADYAQSDVSQHLWSGRLPVPQLMIGEARSGYWSPDFPSDVAAREGLVMGLTETELSSVTAIAIDANLGSFRVDYADQTSRRIGPLAGAMYKLIIDGRGGERVVAIEIQASHVIQGIRLITNRKRQLIVGQVDRNFLRRSMPNDMQIVAGLCCHWDRLTAPTQNLHFAAAMFAPASKNYFVSDSTPTFEEPSLAEIVPIPTSWSVKGPILGDVDLSERTTFLDFSRPVKSITSCLTHPRDMTSPKQLPLMSIIVTYDDGTIASVGPEEFHPIKGPDIEDPSWCWCQYRYGDDKEGHVQTPHHQVDTWTVQQQQQRMKLLRVWKLDDALLGIQFVAEDNTESPKWGSCTEEPTDMISFNDDDGGDDDVVVGLLCFTGSNKRRTIYHDRIVVALQALAITKMSIVDE